MTLPTIPFLEVFEDATSGNVKTKKSDYLKVGEIPVVDQGQGLIGGYVNGRSKICKVQPPVIVFGDHTRIFKYVDFEFAIGADGTKVLKPKVESDARYLYHALTNLRLPDAGYSRHFKFLKRAEIPFPPLPVQKRIAAVLDATEVLLMKRRVSLEHLDDLVDSMFLDMFGDPVRNPEHWSVGRLRDVVARFEGGKNVAQSETETEYRILKVSAVTSGTYRPEESKYLPEDFEIPKPYLVRSGDLLISRANTKDLIGATAYVWKTPDKMVLPDKIWRFVWKDEEAIEPLFVHYLTRQPGFRARLSSRATGTSGSMKNIGKSKLLGLKLPIPPVTKQRDFSRFVMAVRRQSLASRSQLAELESLFASLQFRAFSGEF